MILVNGSFLRRRITGAQRYAREIGLRLLAHDDVRLAWPDPTHPEIPTDRIRPIPPSWLARRLGSRLWTQWDLARAVGSDLLWSPENIGPLGVRRHVISILDLATLDHPEWFAPHFLALYRFYLPRLARQAQHILTISEHSRQRILERFQLDPGRVTAIPCGVSPRFRPCPPAQIAEARRRYDLPPSYILCLGSLEPRKNLLALLRAWRLLDPGSVELVIAGDRAKVFAQQDYRALAEGLSGIRFTGYFPDEDLPALYSGALGFVYPSLYEGFGLPPLEAMACGVPVIASRTTSLPEVVGEEALMIDPSQPESIAAALGQLLADATLREDLARRGRIRAEGFRWEKSAAQVYRILVAQP